MFERPFMLGQVPIAGSPFTGPFGMFSGPVTGYQANPSGTPLMSEELRSPEHYQEELHCYRAPDGSYVSIPFSQAAAYKAAGYEAADASYCPGKPVALGQDDAPSGGPPPVQGNPQGGPAPEPSVPFERQFRRWPRQWWPVVYPPYYPPQPPPQPKMICKRKEQDGEEVFECEPETPPAPPQYTYPVYQQYPIVRIFRPFFF